MKTACPICCTRHSRTATPFRLFKTKKLSKIKIRADIAVLCDLQSVKFDLRSPVKIINCDMDFKEESYSKMKIPSIIIDCGISLKSSVTASSIFDSGINYCIQREFNTFDGGEITPQEFRVNCISDNERGVFKILACITILLLSGVSIEKIKSFNF